MIERIPLFARKAFVDFVETGLAAVLALTWAGIPSDWDQAKEVLALVGAAVLGALISAIRRAAPDAIAWLSEKLGVSRT